MIQCKSRSLIVGIVVAVLLVFSGFLSTTPSYCQDQSKNPYEPAPVKADLNSYSNQIDNRLIVSAPIMSKAQRDALILKWTLITLGILVVLVGLIIWRTLPSKSEQAAGVTSTPDQKDQLIGDTTSTPSAASVTESQPADSLTNSEEKSGLS